MVLIFEKLTKNIKKCVRGDVEKKNEMLFTKSKYVLHKNPAKCQFDIESGME